jgi:hypothetical protein
MDEEKPDTSHLVLRPKEITPINQPSRPGDGTAISVQLIHRQNRIAEERASRVKRPDTGPAEPSGPPPGFRAKEITPLNPPARPDDEDAISVPGILMENQVAEVESGVADVKHRKGRRSKRNRDFFVVVGSLDLAILIAMKLMPDTMTVIFGISAITLVTSMLAWVAFGVMDDY